MTMNTLSARRFRLAMAALFVAVIAIMMLGLHAVAHAATDPVIVERPPPAGWSFRDVVALIALALAAFSAILGALGAVLHFVAPRTKTAWDDRAAVRVDDAHARIDQLEAKLISLFPGAAPAAAAPPVKPASTATVIGLLALVLVGGLGASSLSCATVQAVPGAAKAAVIDCLKLDQTDVSAAAGQIGAAASAELILTGKLNKDELLDVAKPLGLEVGGCALVQFVVELERRTASPPVPSAAESTVVARADPTPARMALEQLRRDGGGVQWRTAAGLR